MAKKAVKKAVKKSAKVKKAAPVRNSTGKVAGNLPLKQQAFVSEYLGNGFNATQAAIAAGYSAKTAESQGSRLLRNVKVAKLLGAKAQKNLEKRDISAERILDEIAKVAFFDVRKLFNPYGSLIPVTQLDDDTAAGIAGFEMIETTTGKGKNAKVSFLKKVKLADKTRNLELLGRHRKLFTDRVEHGADKEFVLTVKSILDGGK